MERSEGKNPFLLVLRILVWWKLQNALVKMLIQIFINENILPLNTYKIGIAFKDGKIFPWILKGFGIPPLYSLQSSDLHNSSWDTIGVERLRAADLIVLHA